MNKSLKALNRQNNELDARISEQNQKIFTDMICYIRGADISDYDQELVRRDLLEMILSAQERGEDIASVIGRDYKEFCDDVIANIEPKTVKQKIIDFFDIICLSVAVLGAINIIISKETVELIRSVVTGQPVDLNIAVSVGELAAGAIIIAVAVFIVGYITKNSFKEENKKGAIVKGAFGGIVIAAGFVLLAWLGKKVLFSINFFAACMIVIALFTAHKILERL